MKHVYLNFFWITTIVLLFSTLYSHSINDLLMETPLQQYLIDIEILEPDTGLELVDCIYVINLYKRIHRWERLRDSLKKRGLFPNRVHAINGWELNEQQIKPIISPKRKMKKGVIGCFLSHLSVLKNAYENEFNIIWVLEDDAEIVDNVEKLSLLLEELQQIDPQWDILYTDVKDFGVIGNGEGIIPIDSINILNENFMRARSRYGMHSVLISKHGIQKLFTYFVSNVLMAPIDIVIHWVPNIRKYSVRKNVVSNLLGEDSTTESPP